MRNTFQRLCVLLTITITALALAALYHADLRAAEPPTGGIKFVDDADRASDDSAAPASVAPATVPVVPGRMVCCEACKARLDLANGIKRCAGCDGMCNAAHTYCTHCAKAKGVCEVCGKPMVDRRPPPPFDPPAAASDAVAQDSRPAGAAGAAKADNQFATSLYQQISSRAGNLFFSPYSIATALNMTMAGARGETADQMAKVLSANPATFSKDQAALVAEIRKAQTKGLELSIANALWGQEGVPFNKDFVDLVKRDFDGSLRPVDFAAADASARIISDWVASQTHDKIKDLINPSLLSPDTTLVLTNAIYFKGAWTEPFQRSLTRDANFTLAVPAASKENAPVVVVPMMHRTGDYRLWQTDGLQVLEMPYGSGRFRMMIVLPTIPLNADATPRHAWRLEAYAELEKSITPDLISKWAHDMKMHEVDIYLPRFKMAAEFSLADTLAAMGMPAAFSARKADFSGITDRPLYISAVVHKAFVDVTEEGTEAAAATGVVEALGKDGGGRPPVLFRADHPFIFVIRDGKTGVILFMGRVMDPTR